MIGTIRFVRSGVARVATLEDDGRWRIVPPLPEPDATEVAGMLTALSEDHDDPSHGPFGPDVINKAWIYLTVTYGAAARHLVTRKPNPAGTIY